MTQTDQGTLNIDFPTSCVESLIEKTKETEHDVSQRGLAVSRRQAGEVPTFLSLPLEIRRHIYGYLLPQTVRLQLPRREHGREIAWQRGFISLLSVSRHIHNETVPMLYGGTNIFVLEVDYDGIRFQFQRLMSSGLIPKQTPKFLDKISRTNARYIRNVIVNVNHVDSYTGMIKYNCGGRGLTNGIKLQVKKLVDVLKTAENLVCVEVHLVDHKIDVKSSQQALEPFSELNNINGQIVVTGAKPPAILENLRRTYQEADSRLPRACEEDGKPKRTRVVPDLALANFYKEIHATPRELQGL